MKHEHKYKNETCTDCPEVKAMNKDKQNKSECECENSCSCHHPSDCDCNNQCFLDGCPCPCHSPTEPKDQKKDSWEETLKELLSEVRQGLKDDVCIYNLIRQVKQQTIAEIVERINKFLDKEWKECPASEVCLGESRYCCPKGTLKSIKYEIGDILQDLKTLLTKE